jgi:ribonuclease BN (tRNA processing enzyme)
MDPESARVTLTFLGCGDAFGSGGRLQTCMHLEAAGLSVLVDCGASACVSLKRFGVDPLAIDAVIISHFHADHFAGLPFLLIESRIRGRAAPLVVAGPPGIEDRVASAMAALFPGSTTVCPFPTRYVEYAANSTITLGPLNVTAFPVLHVPETRPHAVRVDAGNAVIAYSGDTEWTDVLADAARGTDLFICEASTLDRSIPAHLSYASILEHRAALDCRRLVLTHMGEDVIAAARRIDTDGIAAMAADGAAFVV